jgi:transposase-like protein
MIDPINQLSIVLKTVAEEVTPASSSPRNSRNGYSKKTLQTQHGAMELSIPRD